MPTPDRTSLDAIVRAACDLLEEEGLASLTMAAVASRVGVRAPSLYKRVRDRNTLIRLVEEATLAELGARLDGVHDAAELANRYRALGHARPAAFQLVMAPGAGIPPVDEQYRQAATESILRICAELAGEEHALDAARTLTAWCAGFISMELNGSFQLGGDVDRAWEFGVERIVAAITRG
jgi:AcrR family transcriptional regulator